MRRIFLVMVSFGLAIGVVFPFAIDPFVTWEPGREQFFRIACLAAGFAVGIFCYFLVKATIYQKNELLAMQKAEWETCFNNLAEGVVLVDAGGSIKRANGAFSRMVDENPGRLEGADITGIMARNCSSNEKECLISKAMESGECFERESAVGGRVCSQSATPVIDADGAVGGCVFVLRDVTEKKRLHQELVQAARMAAVNHLVSGAAHEINNPLMGVSGTAELLLMQGGLDEKTRAAVETILKESRRASDIVKHLLSYISRSDGQVAEVDMGALLAEAVSLKEYNLKKSGIEVEARPHPEALIVRAAPDQLKQVFFNLIDNAEQALAGNGGERSLRIYIESDGAMMRAHFVDNGPGILPEVREHIFDPFFTTREVGEGTGLGLSMSYEIVKRLDGHIWLEDGDGKGAHFIVELPLVN